MIGFVSGVAKYKGVKLSRIEEVEEYFDERYDKDDEVIFFSGNSKIWVNIWLNKRYKNLNSGNSTYKILTKDIIKEFVDHCNYILKNGFNEFYEDIDFEGYNGDDLDKIEIEICDARDEFESLLNQDFDNNTLIYFENIAV